MSTSDQVVAVLNDDSVEFRFENGSTARAPHEIVQNSKLLNNNLRDALEGDEGSLRLLPGMLQSWLQCIEQNCSIDMRYVLVRTQAPLSIYGSNFIPHWSACF